MGVPESVPVAVLKESPAGRAGLMLYMVAAPPPRVGVISTGSFMVSCRVVVGYDSSWGGTATTEMVTVVLQGGLPRFSAITVYTVTTV